MPQNTMPPLSDRPRISSAMVFSFQLCIVLDRTEKVPLAVCGQRPEGLAVADRLEGKAVPLQRGADLGQLICILAEFLAERLAGLPVLDLQRDADPASVLLQPVAPDAAGLPVRKGEGVVPQHLPVLVGGVHVE